MVSGNDKSPDADETEAEIAVVLKIKIVILGRPEDSRGEARAAVSIPSRTAHVCPGVPVSPVLSGRDQASATLQSQLHPLTGADAQEITMRIWRLHDYLFVKPRREQRATGGDLCTAREGLRPV
jgi:hypothetical protein